MVFEVNAHHKVKTNIAPPFSCRRIHRFPSLSSLVRLFFKCTLCETCVVSSRRCARRPDKLGLRRNAGKDIGTGLIPATDGLVLGAMLGAALSASAAIVDRVGDGVASQKRRARSLKCHSVSTDMCTETQHRVNIL